MEIHVSIVLLLATLAIASGQKQNSKRRPHSAFPKQAVFNSFPQQRSLPQASVEVEQAEVHSEEYVHGQERFQPFQQQDYRETTTPFPKERQTPIPIIRLEKQQSLDGSYKSNYETGNNIQAEETGFLKNIGIPDQETLVQFGSYSYRDPEGQVVSIQYTADEGGFRATGSHIPTAPPVPPEVQKGLDIIFESIRQEEERKAKEGKLKKSKLESDNYPIDGEEGFHGQARQIQHKNSKPPHRH